MAVGISRSIGIGMKKCCGGGTISSPPAPPNSCPLVLDGTGDSLTWADPRATSIAPFTMDFAMDFWFNNKLTTARDFTLLSLGKEISGQFYDTVELKYKSTTNELIVELKGNLAGSPTFASAKFELYSNANSSITGLADVNDKWVECAGNVASHNFVHLFLSLPSADSATNILDATLINIWWNGQLLTASFTQNSSWDVNGSYYINFLTLGDYRGPNTPATASAAHADMHKFVWQDSYYQSSTTTAGIIYNNGYPHTTLYLFNWYAQGIVDAAPQGTTKPSDLYINNGNPISAQLNDNAVVLCGPVIYPCTPQPPPSTFAVTLGSSQPTNTPSCTTFDLTVNVYNSQGGNLVATETATKISNNNPFISAPQITVSPGYYIECVVTSQAPGNVTCQQTWTGTDVFLETGPAGGSLTNRLIVHSEPAPPGPSIATATYSFFPVQGTEDEINIYSVG